MDKNGDNSVSFEEFVEYMKVEMASDEFKLRAAAVQELDPEKTGKISKESLKAFLAKRGKEASVEEVYKAADFDGDGVLTSFEFAFYLAKNPIHKWVSKLFFSYILKVLLAFLLMFSFNFIFLIFVLSLNFKWVI